MKATLILASALLASSLHAQTTLLTTDPAAPLAGQPVVINLSSDWGCPPSAWNLEADLERKTIDFIVSSETTCPPAIVQWTLTAITDPIGPGSWRLRALSQQGSGSPTLLADRTLFVRSTAGELAIHPRTVPVRGGMLVRIERAGIGECPASGTCLDPVVRIGGIEATVATIDRTHLDVVVPPHEAGFAGVRVTGRDGSTTWTEDEAIVYFSPNEAPNPSLFERVLVPLMFEGPGGFGSLWTTELRIFNRGFFAIDPLNQFNIPCQGPYGCPPRIPANAVLRVGVPELLQWNHGYVLAVPREVSGDLAYGLHIRDLSRTSEGWGTEVPVVRESEMSGTVTLLDVPLEERYRRTLRIYGLDAIDGSEVTLTWRDDHGFSATQNVVLRTLGRCELAVPCWLPEPAGAILPLEPPYPANMEAGERVRLEIAARNPLGAKIWAMVSLTNNETQQVTTITPQ